MSHDATITVEGVLAKLSEGIKGPFAMDEKSKRLRAEGERLVGLQAKHESLVAAVAASETALSEGITKALAAISEVAALEANPVAPKRRGRPPKSATTPASDSTAANTTDPPTELAD